MKRMSTSGLVRRSFDLLGLSVPSRRKRRHRAPRPSLRCETLEPRQLMSVSPAPALPDAAALPELGSAAAGADYLIIAADQFHEKVQPLALTQRSPIAVIDPRAVDRINLSSVVSQESGRLLQMVGRGSDLAPIIARAAEVAERGQLAVIDPRAVDRINLSSMALQSSGGAIGAERAQIAVIDPRAVDRINLSSAVSQESEHLLGLGGRRDGRPVNVGNVLAGTPDHRYGPALHAIDGRAISFFPSPGLDWGAKSALRAIDGLAITGIGTRAGGEVVSSDSF